MKKYLYLVVGLISIISAIPYGISFFNNFSPVTYSLLLSLAYLFIGITYTYYYIKPGKINVFSNYSVAILIPTWVITFIMILFSCISYCPNNTPYIVIFFTNHSGDVFVAGFTISLVLLIISLFKKNKR